MEEFLELIIFVCIALIIFITFMMFRNNMVYKHRMRANGIVSLKSKDAINKGDDEWRIHWDKLGQADSYDKMLWSLSKWRFESFYPDLENNIPKEAIK